MKPLEPSPRLLDIIDDICRQTFVPPTKCEYCGESPVEKVYAMTAYSWDGQGEDPNRALWLCDRCSEEYHEHWTEMWREYRYDKL